MLDRQGFQRRKPAGLIVARFCSRCLLDAGLSRKGLRQELRIHRGPSRCMQGAFLADWNALLSGRVEGNLSTFRSTLCSVACSASHSGSRWLSKSPDGAPWGLIVDLGTTGGFGLTRSFSFLPWYNTRTVEVGTTGSFVPVRGFKCLRPRGPRGSWVRNSFFPCACCFFLLGPLEKRPAGVRGIATYHSWDGVLLRM